VNRMEAVKVLYFLLCCKSESAEFDRDLYCYESDTLQEGLGRTSLFHKILKF
jgi:hypothetical protein